MSFYGYPEYVPVAERRRTAQNKVEKLKKKNPEIAPVIMTGRRLAVTWWGIAWNNNLESYSIMRIESVEAEVTCVTGPCLT